MYFIPKPSKNCTNHRDRDCFRLLDARGLPKTLSRYVPEFRSPAPVRQVTKGALEESYLNAAFGVLCM